MTPAAAGARGRGRPARRPAERSGPPRRRGQGRLRAGACSTPGCPWWRRARSCPRSWVPQMAGSDEVLRRLRRPAACACPCSSPTARGSRPRARRGAREIAIFTAASETFNRKNINASIDESFARFAEFVPDARRDGMWVRGYVSTCFGCPYEGAVDPARWWTSRGGWWTSDATRSRSATPSAWPSPPRSTDVMGRLKEAVPADGARRPLPRHARDRARQRAGRAAGGHRGRGQLGGRPRRLPLRARGERQSRDRGPPLHAARDGHRDRRGPGQGGARLARARPAPRPRAAQPLPAGLRARAVAR